MTKAIVAGSFDPITRGHMWLISCALKSFDEVVIVVAENAAKTHMFSIEERVLLVNFIKDDLTKEKDQERLSVQALPANKFLIKHVKEIDGTHIVRGIRNSADLDYERDIIEVNRVVAREGLESSYPMDPETVFFIPPKWVGVISSSLIKNLVKLDGWQYIVGNYVPVRVLDALKYKLENPEKSIVSLKYKVKNEKP